MKRTFTLFFFYETIKYDLILKSSENHKKNHAERTMMGVMH